MHNVGIVIENLPHAIAFFEALGLKVEGQVPVGGKWVDQVVGLDGVQCDIVMMCTPDGHSRIELTKFQSPKAIAYEPQNAPANAIGIRRIMFAVDNIDETVARLQKLGGEVFREIVKYEDAYRLCYVRGPEGLIVAIAQPLS